MGVYPSTHTWPPFLPGADDEVLASATTLAVWNRFPEKDRLPDEATGWQLLRFLSLLFDQADDINALADRFAITEVGESSHLTDPVLADSAWLPWLAQFLGIASDNVNLGELRLAIINHLFDASSTASIRRYVLTFLVDPQRYEIIRHADGNPWVVRIYAHPDDADQATWNSWLTDYPTWAQFELAATTWEIAEGASRLTVGALEHLRPAGVRFVVLLQAQAWDLVEANVVDWDMWEAEFESWDEYETGDQYF